MSESVPGRPEKDPFPKMIIVCAAISAVLFVLIVAALLFDASLRAQNRVPVPGFNSGGAGQTRGTPVSFPFPPPAQKTPPQ